MSTLPQFDPIEFAALSAEMAFDYVPEHDNIEDAVGSAFDNLRSTFVDYGVKDQFTIADAEAMFWHTCCIHGYTRPEYR